MVVVVLLFGRVCTTTYNIQLLDVSLPLLLYDAFVISIVGLVQNVRQMIRIYLLSYISKLCTSTSIRHMVFHRYHAFVAFS